MTIYRGYEIELDNDGSFYWQDENGELHAAFATDEKAMDSIDAHKRSQVQS